MTSFAKDEDRPLTKEGAIRVRKILFLAKSELSVEVDRILSSPHKRAVETAEIAKEILKPKKPKIVTNEALTSQKSPYELYAFISKQKFGPLDRVLIVSHQPIVGEAISDLIGSSINFGFPPGSIARVDAGQELSSRSGTLIWLISSDVI